MNDKPDDVYDLFCERLDKACGEWPSHHLQIVIENANMKIGGKGFFRPVIGTESLLSTTNDNDLRHVTFAAANGLAFSSPFFARNNITHLAMNFSGINVKWRFSVLKPTNFTSSFIWARNVPFYCVDPTDVEIEYKVSARIGCSSNT